uniref:Uncharacterized protein n=1 Tax=Arundo donax TaxID=35708 RepID=A0A0A9B6X3_ARUDO
MVDMWGLYAMHLVGTHYLIKLLRSSFVG